jgi:hypothetical protein
MRLGVCAPRIGAVFWRYSDLPVALFVVSTRRTRLTDKGLVWPMSKRVRFALLSALCLGLALGLAGRGGGVALVCLKPWLGVP